MGGFQQRDPLLPAFWDERFSQRFTPWDRGGVPEALRQFIAANAPMRTLIPGCGAAYELAAMADAGWDATAIDFSPQAVQAGKLAAGDHAARVVQADFFEWQPARPPQPQSPPQPQLKLEPQLELIYERAFLCAMPRAMWPAVAARWAQLLPVGALLAGYFFFDDGEKGPPFGIAREQLDALLRPQFDCIADDAVSDSIPVFEGKERWMIWRRAM